MWRIIAGATLILMQLARWSGLGAGNTPFGPGAFKYVMLAMFFLFPLVGIPIVLRRSSGRIGSVAVLAGAFLVLNDVRLGVDVWSGWAILLCGAIAVVEGLRARANARDVETRNRQTRDWLGTRSTGGCEQAAEQG